jgi:hypothetical protein
MNALIPTLRLTHLWFVLMGVCFPSFLMAQNLVGYVTELNLGRKFSYERGLNAKNSK